MNDNLTPTNEQKSGPRYWRSLEHKADSPEFRAFVEKEFPSGVDLIDDPVSRRNFMKIMSASFALAGLGVSGCRRPEHKILPFSKMPENYVHGAPQLYATSMPTRQSAVPLVVKSYDGRPIKVEGNAEHPNSNGGTDQYAQASILSLYDPDRGLNFKLAETDDKGVKSLKVIAKAKVLEQLDNLANGKTHVLMEQSSSPSRARLVAGLKAKGVNFYEYEPIDFSVHAEAVDIAFGPGVKPYYKLDKAKAILSLDCDFLGTEESAFQHIRDFADGRRVKDDHKENPAESMNRLYSVEGLLTLTGTNADHRLRIPTGSVIRVAALALAEALDKIGLDGAEDGIIQLRAFAADLNKDFSSSHAVEGEAKTDTVKWVRQCVADLIRLAKRGEKTLVLAGYRQPKEVHLAAMAMNELLGNVGSTLLLQKTNPSGNGTIADLKLRFNDGDNLVVLGGDPAYNAPTDIEWAKLASRAGRVIRQGYYIDQTAKGADAYIPAAHYLESWGDARTSDGTLVPVQPLIAPLFGGMTELEVLARIGGTESDPYKIVRKTFDGIAASADAKWEKFLHDGYLADSASAVESRGYDWDAAQVAWEDGAKPVEVPGKEKYEVTFFRDHSVDDGRWGNNGWLLETPNPVTRVTWDNVLLVSLNTAQELLGSQAIDLLDFQKVNGEEYDKKLGGLPGRFGFHSESGRFFQKEYNLTINGKKVKGAIWLLPGMADNTVGVALGYGRGVGRVGGAAGFNAYEVRTAGEQHFAAGAKLESAGSKYEVACTQEQGVMDGRPVVRECNADDYSTHKDFVKHFDLDSIHHTSHLVKGDDRGYPWEKDRKQDEELPASPYKNNFGGEDSVSAPKLMDIERQQWGMVIDLGTCVGCNACVVACQSENNIPIVGKHQVAIGREMSWINIHRYFSGDEHNPQVTYQGVACQHCEDAPCESVCPVNATVHDEEGLNLMAYNRCVGTRYCSNNCPYKVRRFNYYDYNRRPMGVEDGERKPGKFFNDDNDLNNSPLHPGNKSSNGEWELIRWYKDPSRGSVPGLDDGKKENGEFDPEWDLIKLSKNPNVSVRMRGVMEKCTYCVQRIQSAKIEHKAKVRDTVANLEPEKKISTLDVPDGTIVTACEQACPANSITFGDISDPKTEVYRLKRQNRNYSVLGFLDTRPRTTYLAKLRNPNASMPDYFDMPNTVTEYNDKNHGDVFKRKEGKTNGKESKH
ncbi:MAG: TAT-variant-translocated molybdopterin oxidoreductase [Verrucomicrobia bacterium]|nr:TAT-variant-translocated molybdopterin oxidoreductase [Verrucomicrobiota bacterium]